MAIEPDDAGLIARRADVLAHAGRYADALSEFDRYEKAAGSARLDVWALEHDALRTVVDRIGTGTQNRTEPPPDADPDAVLAADALSPHAWIQIAADAASSDYVATALDALLVACAFPSADVPEPWPTALQVTCLAGLDELFDRLAAVAWRRFGDRLVADVLAHNDALDPADLAVFMKAFDTRIGELKAATTRGVDIRFLHDDGTRDVVNFRTSPREPTE